MKRLHYTLGTGMILAVLISGCAKKEKVKEPDRPAVISSLVKRVMEEGSRRETDEGVEYVLDVRITDFFQSGDGIATVTLRDPEPFASSPLEIGPGDTLRVSIENQSGHTVAFIEDHDVNGYQGEDLASKYSHIDRLNQRVLYTDYVARTDLGKGISVFYEVVGVALNALEGKSFKPLNIKEPLEPTEPVGPRPEPPPAEEPAAPSEPPPGPAPEAAPEIAPGDPPADSPEVAPEPPAEPDPDS